MSTIENIYFIYHQVCCKQYHCKFLYFSIVVGPAHVISSTDNFIAPQSSKITLECVASGAPPITYSWRKDGIILTNGGRIQGTNTSQLVIISMNVNDIGYYECHPENSIYTFNYSTIEVGIKSESMLGWMDRQIDRWMDKQMDRWMDRQIDRWMDIQIDRWMDRQIDRWMDR